MRSSRLSLPILTDPFVNLEPQNRQIDITELRKIRQPTDFESLKL